MASTSQSESRRWTILTEMWNRESVRSTSRGLEVDQDARERNGSSQLQTHSHGSRRGRKCLPLISCCLICCLQAHTVRKPNLPLQWLSFATVLVGAGTCLQFTARRGSYTVHLPLNKCLVCVPVLPHVWCQMARSEHLVCKSPIVHYSDDPDKARDTSQILCDKSPR